MRSEIYSFLSGNAVFIIGVFDQPHLRDEICQCNQVIMRIATGQDHMQILRLFSEQIKDPGDIKEPQFNRDIDLVKNYQIPVSGEDTLL